MQCKSILCAYSGDLAQGGGLRHAVALARHHGAYLTGVVSHGTSVLESRYSSQIPDSFKDELRAADEARIASVAERFATAVEQAGMSDRAEFIEIDPVSDGPLSAFAHAFDLIVTGVHSEAANEAHLSAHPDVIALKSGRPVLVVPDGCQVDVLADRAIAAWDGKRASARALGDAMSVFAEWAHVTLLSVGASPRGTDRMVQNIDRRGVKAAARSVARTGSVAETILAEARRDGAKLIVMGAFEHSKFSHDLFGGVTTEVIARAKVPILMAH